MKNFGKMIFGAALIASFASCTNETNFGQESAGQVEEGIPTYARIKLSVKSVGSRAALSRSAAMDDEKKLAGGVRILIFDKSNVLESEALIDDVENAKLIQTTSGKKTIYAIANPKAGDMTQGTEEAIKEIKIGMTLSQFQNLQLDAVKQTVDGGNSEVLVARANHFLMAGFTDATLQPKAGDEFNTVAIDVTRLASKAAMKLSEDAKKSDANFKPSNTAVTVAEAKFQLAQMNKKSFVYVVNNAYSPSGDDNQVSADYESQKTCSHLTVGDWKVVNTWVDDLAANSFTEASLTKNNFAYTSENINKTPRVGNVTFAMIKVKLTPTKFTKEEGTYANETFYALVQYSANGVTKADQINEYLGIYKDKATAEAAKADFEGKDNLGIIEYNGGIAYYRINLINRDKKNAFERYALNRNSYYQITVNGINNTGVSDPKDLFPSDQTTPVEETTNIKATINVVEWNDISMTEPLG